MKRLGAVAAICLSMAASGPALGHGFEIDPARGVVSMAPLLEQVTPAVVNIAVRASVSQAENPLMRDPFFRRFFGEGRRPAPRRRGAQSAGSGVIVDASAGYILTNAHVVEGADAITVTLKDGRQIDAKLVGADPATDIALLQAPARGLTALWFGDSDAVKVGDLALAIGNPFGLGQTVTSGMISAVGRQGLSADAYEDFLQTDAAINPGNSGGALINSRGELIGVNTAILSRSGGNVGIGFAVPSNMARAVMDQLARHGEVRRGRIGVRIQTLTPDLARSLGVSGARGAIVAEVEDGSPAARAGLREGDVITRVDGAPIDDAGDVRNRIGLREAGGEVRVNFLRDGRERELYVRIGAF